MLNLAIGGPPIPPNPGTFLGTPDPKAPFAPQDMLVDYVRVYQQTDVAASTPVIAPGRVVNAASGLGTLAGSIATLYGANLADQEHLVSGAGGFPASVAGVTVSVGGVKVPLLYVSSGQINFQIPWETPPGTSVDVKVTREGVDSAAETVTVAPAAPSVFLSELTNGVAWVTGAGCETAECAVRPGVVYQLWANGFGPKNGPSQNGVAAVYAGSLTPLQVPGDCQLTIGGQPAMVQYCGAAPGEIIDQLNFVYPSGTPMGASYVDAAVTIGGVTGRFRLPSPN